MRHCADVHPAVDCGLCIVDCAAREERHCGAEKDGNKHLLLNVERTQYWLALGAVPSPTVSRVLGQIGVLPPLPFRPALPRATKKPDKWRKTKSEIAAR
jgi:ribosomal protein S16